jgi:hypothetical protein
MLKKLHFTKHKGYWISQQAATVMICGLISHNKYRNLPLKSFESEGKHFWIEHYLLE